MKIIEDEIPISVMSEHTFIKDRYKVVIEKYDIILYDNYEDKEVYRKSYPEYNWDVIKMNFNLN